MNDTNTTTKPGVLAGRKMNVNDPNYLALRILQGEAADLAIRIGAAIRMRSENLGPLRAERSAVIAKINAMRSEQ